MNDATPDVTAPRWEIQCQQRRITIAGFLENGRRRLEIALDHGMQAHLVLAATAEADALIRACEAVPAMGLLPADGGLPATLPVATSLALALTWDREPALGSSWDQRLELAFTLCGFTTEESAALGRRRPLDLPRMTRWRLGLIRHLVRPPDLLILDRVFDGLAPAEANIIHDGLALFHTLHPFRATLRIDLAAHDASRGTLSPEAVPCPS